MKTRWNKPIAILQILGGIVGILVSLVSLAALKPNFLIILIFLPFVSLYLLSIVAGVLLWRRHRLGIPLSVIVQVPQIISFSINKLAYLFISGLQIAFILKSKKIAIEFMLGSKWHLNFATEDHSLTIGLNIIALFIVIYLLRQIKKPHKI